MSFSLSEVLEHVQDETGWSRFNYISIKDIMRQLDKTRKTFSDYFPYKTYYPLQTQADAVDPVHRPGLFYIKPDDCPISDIIDSGMVFSSGDMHLGGFHTTINTSVYSRPNALMYGQMRANIASMMTPQTTTGEFTPPNLIQLYPLSRFRNGSGASVVIIELLLRHSPSLTTVQPAYREMYLQLAELDVMKFIYNKYRDLAEQGVIGGHQVNTMIGEFSSARQDRRDMLKEWDTEAFRNPDRMDAFFI